MESKFVADAMLGSLARKLRILGFDTTYHKTGPDNQLISSASAEGRIVLTSDRDLWNQNSSHLRVLLIRGNSDRERLVSLLRQAKSSGIKLVGRDSRCALCNGALKTSTKNELKGKVRDSILAKHRSFNTCRVCGKVYWRGRHWPRLRRFSYLLTSTKGFNPS